MEGGGLTLPDEIALRTGKRSPSAVKGGTDRERSLPPNTPGGGATGQRGIAQGVSESRLPDGIPRRN